MRESLKQTSFWAVLAFTALMIFLSGTIPYTTLPFSQWDLLNYRNMAQFAPGIDLSVCPPYTYRILGPYLIGLVPLSDVHAFYWTAVILSFVLAASYYSLVCRLGLSRSIAALVTILFTMNRYFFGFTVWDFFQIDDLISEVLLVLLFISMLQGKWLRYSLLLAAGALTRESVFIIVPTTLVYLWENKKLKSSLLSLVGATAPGLLIFIGLRILLKSTCTDHEAGLPQNGAEYYGWAFLHYIRHFFAPETIFRRLVNAFAPFSLLPIVFFGQTRDFMLKNKYMAVFYIFVFAATLFGGDYERLMAPSFIVFYYFLGLIIQKTSASRTSASRTSVTRPVVFAAMLVTAFMSTLHYQNARFKLPSQKYAIAFSMGSLCLMTLLAILYRLNRKNKISASFFRAKAKLVLFTIF
jgi:hypothetical protein